MRIYVASRFSDEGVAAVRKMYEVLRAAGHEITHDWTQEAADGKTGEELTKYLSDCAWADVAAVRRADALVFIDIDNTRMRGAYVEFGIALGLGRTCIVFNAKPGTLGMPGSCIFFMPPDVHKVSTHEEVLRILDEKEKILCGYTKG